MKPVKNGIPQRFPISTILTIFETPANPIKIPENYAYNHPTHISILIYVDDRKLTVCHMQAHPSRNYIPVVISSSNYTSLPFLQHIL